MVRSCGRDESDNQQGRKICEHHFQRGAVVAACAECAACSGPAYRIRTGCTLRTFSLGSAFSSTEGASTSCARNDSAKSKGCASTHAKSRAATGGTVESDQSRPASTAPIVICCVWFPIGSCRKQIITGRVFCAWTAIDIRIAPGVFWQLLEKLIPTSRLRIAVWLHNECLQPLLRRRIKSIHAFVK